VAKLCPFCIHAAWSKRNECVVVSSIQLVDTCLGSSQGQRGTNYSTKWLQRVPPELIVLKWSTKSQATTLCCSSEVPCIGQQAVGAPCDTRVVGMICCRKCPSIRIAVGLPCKIFWHKPVYHLDRIQHCSGCGKTGHHVATYREPKLPIVGL
jgi:hypothetical protein